MYDYNHRICTVIKINKCLLQPVCSRILYVHFWNHLDVANNNKIYLSLEQARLADATAALQIKQSEYIHQYILFYISCL